jgi:hypothetical protein
VVAQEYLVGSEYIVDMVSRDGVHHVTDIWRYEKLAVNDRVDLTAGMLLLPRRGEVQDQLVPYAFRVLDALGIAHGPSHMEIKLTPDGPCLVEVGARICGLDLPSISTLALGEGQLEWTVDALTDPGRFHARHEVDYQLSQSLAVVCLVAPFDGVVAEYPLLPQVEALESFHSAHVSVQPGKRMQRTVDDMGWPMAVTLLHPLLECVLRDEATVRYLDGPGFYRLAEEEG